MATRSDRPARYDWLETLPRFQLGFLPTPLVPLERFSEVLGGPRIWIKRDDCTGLATGGNKTRKLEYLIGDARARQATSVLTFGAVQSNHARQTAAACAKAGLACHLILSRRVQTNHPDYERSGNVLLDRLLGASIEFAAPEDVSTAAKAFTSAARDRGERVYVIPTGGSNAVGARGYARCALELLLQSRDHGFSLTDVLHASSSAGTQAGLLAGFAAFAEQPPRVHGINVYSHTPQTLAEQVLTLANEMLVSDHPNARVSADPTRASEPLIPPHAVHIDSRHLGPDYGIPAPNTRSAIELLARTEGILTDPVYSGKALAALIERVRHGEFADSSNVVFIHTGGSAVLPVYENVLADP